VTIARCDSSAARAMLLRGTFRAEPFFVSRIRRLSNFTCAHDRVNYSVSRIPVYGFLPLVVSKYYGQISRTLGKLHFLVVFVAAAMLDIAIEAFVISGLGVYAYHQAPQYLFLGVAWSNT